VIYFWEFVFMPLPTTTLIQKPFAPFRFFAIAIMAFLFSFFIVNALPVRAQTPPADPTLNDDFAFLSRTDKGWRVYLMNADGSDRRPATTQINFPRSTINMYSAVFSPDRTYIAIALVMYNDSGSEHRLYRVDADGKGLKLLWHGLADYLNPVWSPKGDRIAFSAFSEEMSSQTYIINSDGSGLTLLDTGEARLAGSLVWSPSEEQIAFMSAVGDDYSLSVINTDGSGFQSLVEGYIWGATWSLSGEQILFVSDTDGDLYLINPDGSGLEQLTDMGSVFSSIWSPDGTKIAFVSTQNDETNLYMINPDGSELTELTDVGAKGFACPQWLPNGEQLVVLMAPKDRMFYDTDTNLYAVKADGSGEMTQLTDASEVVSLPTCGALFG
jgi:Tol biopolymer transport system component